MKMSEEIKLKIALMEMMENVPLESPTIGELKDLMKKFYSDRVHSWGLSLTTKMCPILGVFLDRVIHEDEDAWVSFIGMKYTDLETLAERIGHGLDNMLNASPKLCIEYLGEDLGRKFSDMCRIGWAVMRVDDQHGKVRVGSLPIYGEEELQKFQRGLASLFIRKITSCDPMDMLENMSPELSSLVLKGIFKEVPREKRQYRENYPEFMQSERYRQFLLKGAKEIIGVNLERDREEWV